MQKNYTASTLENPGLTSTVIQFDPLLPRPAAGPDGQGMEIPCGACVLPDGARAAVHVCAQRAGGPGKVQLAGLHRAAAARRARAVGPP